MVVNAKERIHSPAKLPSLAAIDWQAHGGTKPITDRRVRDWRLATF